MTRGEGGDKMRGGGRVTRGEGGDKMRGGGRGARGEGGGQDEREGINGEWEGTRGEGDRGRGQEDSRGEREGRDKRRRQGNKMYTRYAQTVSEDVSMLVRVWAKVLNV